ESRTASRNSLGSERYLCLSRLSDHLGPGAISGSRHRRESGSRRATRKRWRRAHCEIGHQYIGRRFAFVVSRNDPQSLESALGCCGFVVRISSGDCRWTCGLFHWHGNIREPHRAIDEMWRRRTASDLWSSQPLWLYAALLVAG